MMLFDGPVEKVAAQDTEMASIGLTGFYDLCTAWTDPYVLHAVQPCCSFLLFASTSDVGLEQF